MDLTLHCRETMQGFFFYFPVVTYWEIVAASLWSTRAIVKLCSEVNYERYSHRALPTCASGSAGSRCPLAGLGNECIAERATQLVTYFLYQRTERPY